MIYTVTLNPCIDYVVHLDQLTLGLTNRTTGEEMSIGGKGINVSCILAELGADSTALGFVAGFTGDAIQKGIRHERIATDFITLREGCSRINVKIKAGAETEINGQGPDIAPDELDRLIGKLDVLKDGDTLILSGSIPRSLPDDVYERMLKRIDGRGVRIVVDATGQLLRNTLPYRPFLIKPNRQELSELFDREVKTAAETVACAEELQKMGAQNVLVSLGKEGALLLDETGHTHLIGILPRKPINTVGSGDSMVAGFVFGYLSSGDYDYALTLGSACGNATAFSSGLATKDEIDDCLRQFQAIKNH
ncbi:MAG: 1-phosphofructokinase [Clostridia bacterium]|nr:1-phosphofructokinase [Clostridia bacterium]